MDTSTIWAKSGDAAGGAYLPLSLHLIDVACCADAILDLEPESTRERMGACLGLPWEQARPWVLLLVACHDIGKACAPFQAKWAAGRTAIEAGGLRFPPAVDTHINHAWVSQAYLEEELTHCGWPSALATLAADAVGCHHGERAGESRLSHLRDNRYVWQDSVWAQARDLLFKALLGLFKPGLPPPRECLDGPDFMLLSGLTSFADWIGSSEVHFPFGNLTDCQDLEGWWKTRLVAANEALASIGWSPRTPLFHTDLDFQEVFQFPPRPLQEAVAQAVETVSGPCVLLVEAPMGEGKTEAAFFAHGQLQRRFGHRGLYVALPTKATGNAMFARTIAFITQQAPERTVDLQLLHGATELNERFQELRQISILDPEGEGRMRAGEWFTHRKRALLSEYGVGTVDQALLPILPVRHQFVRLWGLANRVVIFDEIHAYDTYTGTLMIHLIQWLVALGSSVVLLSATLPPKIRRCLASILGASMPDEETPYPRLTVIQSGNVHQVHFEADPNRRRTLQVQAISADLTSIQAALECRLGSRGYALALLNTVQRAQALYSLYPAGEPILVGEVQVGKRLPDGTEVLLFHARFPADLRQIRENHVIETFGKKATRTTRRILIATQVAEQSLDLDFDLMLTDLAPIDLILQRAGRLWRHERENRPAKTPILLIAGLEGPEPPSFGTPLWWGAVYREDVLLRTWALLKNRDSLTLPDEIDTLVMAVYEDGVPIPDSLIPRLDVAIQESLGKGYAERTKALMATIGSPDDSSWNDPSRYIKADEDEPGLHPSLRALTRLGDESVTVIPIRDSEDFHPAQIPSAPQARAWSLRSLSLSRKQIVKQLQAQGIPEGWQQSSLLRHSYPMHLDAEGRWHENPLVHLDEALGLVFETKEVH